jgi:choice-of-anchor B domain-containing protein
MAARRPVEPGQDTMESQHRRVHARIRTMIGTLPVLAAVAETAAPFRAAAQEAVNTELLSHVGGASGRGAYAAVWGYTAPDGTELALIGTHRATEIYDVTDPRSPLLVDSIPGPRSQWREMQTWSHYAYIVTEGTGPESRGMQIVDLADPHAPHYVGDFDSTFVTAHTIHLAGGYAYLNGTNNGWRVLDLADPERPRDVSGWSPMYVHDCYVRGDLAYLATIGSGGFAILDIADRARPRLLSFTPYDGAAAHNCWTTQDGRYLLTTDETTGGHLRVWNVENPALPVQVAEWSAHPAASIHNVVVRGDSAYIAYYTEGLQVLDVSRPMSPQLVASYDTWPGVSGGYNGNWGVYPLARSGNVYLSDITSGLFVVRLTGGGQPVADFRLEAPSGQTALPGQSFVWFFFDLFNTGGGTRTYDLAATSTLGWTTTVVPSITIPRGGVEGVQVTVHVPEAVAGPARVDVDLCVRSRTVGREECARTRLAVPVALQAFEAAEAADGGVVLRWRLELEGAGRAAGSLLVQRTQEDGGGGVTLARLALDATTWHDVGAEPGMTYTYRLLLEGAAGTGVLGTTRVALGASERSRLVGAFPNPAREAASVRFDLARPGDALLEIFDARGRRLRTLLAPGLRSGRHALAWDGRDVAGRRAPSGVYFYLLQSRSWTARGRITVLHP